MELDEQDPLVELIARSRITYCDWMRVDFDGEYFFISLYNEKKHKTFRTVIDKQFARDLREALSAFLDDEDFVDLRDKKAFDVLYR